MDQPTILSEPDSDFKPEYPAPPRVHWIVLASAAIVLWILDLLLIPKPAQTLFATVVWYAWITYLCFWIRKINPDSNCLFWAVLCFFLDFPDPNKIGWTFSVLVAFVVRDELLEQYNQREPIHLRLDPAMTFFFSFVYFQYHLYDIAMAKRQQATVPVQEPVRTLLS